MGRKRAVPNRPYALPVPRSRVGRAALLLPSLEYDECTQVTHQLQQLCPSTFERGPSKRKWTHAPSSRAPCTSQLKSRPCLCGTIRHQVCGGRCNALQNLLTRRMNALLEGFNAKPVQSPPKYVPQPTTRPYIVSGRLVAVQTSRSPCYQHYWSACLTFKKPTSSCLQFSKLGLSCSTSRRTYMRRNACSSRDSSPSRSQAPACTMHPASGGITIST